MDVDRAICKLASEVAQVPCLEDFADVALQCIKTVQVFYLWKCVCLPFTRYSKIFQHNNVRLLFMPSNIVEDLTSMADYMRDRWDTAPEGLKHHLDEFEGFVLIWVTAVPNFADDCCSLLSQILGKLKKRRKGSRFLSLIKATERDVKITGLQKRLDHVYDSILVYG
jgi:hypothetical protein